MNVGHARIDLVHRNDKHIPFSSVRNVVLIVWELSRFAMWQWIRTVVLPEETKLDLSVWTLCYVFCSLEIDAMCVQCYVVKCER